jgi:hypothetical protein
MRILIIDDENVVSKENTFHSNIRLSLFFIGENIHICNFSF